MRDGRAEKTWVKGVFAIRMKDVDAGDPDVVVDGVEVNVDPGASATGIAVVSERDGTRHAHALVELRHRGNRVRNKLIRRRAFRRSRRGRIRNRKPRFDNRTRPAGWLPPSLVSRLENTLTWAIRLAAIFPVRLIRVEDAVFDTQLMADAEISGAQYQEGDLLGWQLRSYVFHRDGRVCAYCGTREAERYELDHMFRAACAARTVSPTWLWLAASATSARATPQLPSSSRGTRTDWRPSGGYRRSRSRGQPT